MLHLTDVINKQIENIVNDEIKIGNESATVKIIDLIFEKALKLKSSDIHIDFIHEHCAIRFRIDGLLNDIVSIPSSFGIKVVSRIKVIAGMDITQNRLPQDGRKTVTFNDKNIDIRISTLPTKYGESVVLRLLPKDFKGLNLNQLGLLDNDLNKIRSIINKKKGIILVVGPTGCGKTTTLYAILREINDNYINIISLEDPIESDLSFVRQSQIRTELGYNFSTALRSVLRQDPDVIMIGEIRDEETLNTAFKAALTGHLVLSTLHTRDTIQTISRLREMGLPNYIISSALKCVIAQRLIRKMCNYCFGIGCEKCYSTGIKGRIGIFEVLNIDENISNLILNNASLSTIKQQLLKTDFRTFYSDAEIKITNNIINREEVFRVMGKND